MERFTETSILDNGINKTQKARAERNRLKALTLRESKLLQPETTDACVLRVAGAALADTGGGFLLEEETAPPAGPTRAPAPAPPAPPDPAAPSPRCLVCGERFAASFLHTNFGHPACDACRDADPGHELVARTEGKARYLLRDADLDARDPPLPHLERRNPHRRGGTMRLYLAAHLHDRALLVWGSSAALDGERARRAARGDAARAQRYRRHLAGLRRGVCGAPRAPPAPCAHRYRESALDADRYRGECEVCGHEIVYEKM